MNGRTIFNQSSLTIVIMIMIIRMANNGGTGCRVKGQDLIGNLSRGASNGVGFRDPTRAGRRIMIDIIIDIDGGVSVSVSLGLNVSLSNAARCQKKGRRHQQRQCE